MRKRLRGLIKKHIFAIRDHGVVDHLSQITMPNRPRRTSLKDLADKLGVSIATISRALRNSHEVGEDMTRKVQALAKEMNYRPNPFAQSLRKDSPKVIGVIVPNLVTHYYASVRVASVR